MAARSTPPPVGHLEISVFGARKGESTVIHAPDGSWIVIDSFRTRAGGGSAVPVAAAYLDLLGVSALHELFLTHWHEDHTNGASQLVRRYAGTLRTVGLPSGVGEGELASFISDLLPHPLRSRLVTDLVDVISALREPAAANIRALMLCDGTSLSAHPTWSLSALSPSFEDQKLQLATLGKFLPHQRGARIGSFDVNSGSVVLRLEANNVVAIFSSDLDIGDDEKRGWRCIVKFHGARLAADLVKVGHHGSVTALHEPAWAAFRKGPKSPSAVVTPFPARAEALPRANQIRRLKTLSSTLHLSGIRAHSGGKAGLVAVSRTPFSAYTKVSPSPFDLVGHVRYRFDPAGIMTTEVFPPAHQL